MPETTPSSASEEPMTDHAPPADAPASDAPPLNRAQRRAKGKGNNATGKGASPQHGGGGTPRPSGQAGQVRFPRTGHK